jgi:hypothetical protein
MTTINQDDEIVAAGAAEWKRKNSGSDWDGWVVIGRALAVGRAVALRLCGSNNVMDGRYRLHFGAWLKDQGFAEMNPTERAIILQCMDRLDAITRWRATLPTHRLREWNCPAVVWQRFNEATNEKAPGIPELHKVREQRDVLAAENERLKAQVASRDDAKRAIGSEGDGATPLPKAVNASRLDGEIDFSGPIKSIGARIERRMLTAHRLRQLVTDLDRRATARERAAAVATKPKRMSLKQNILSVPITPKAAAPVNVLARRPAKRGSLNRHLAPAVRAQLRDPRLSMPVESDDLRVLPERDLTPLRREALSRDAAARAALEEGSPQSVCEAW